MERGNPKWVKKFFAVTLHKTLFHLFVEQDMSYIRLPTGFQYIQLPADRAHDAFLMTMSIPSLQDNLLLADSPNSRPSGDEPLLWYN